MARVATANKVIFLRFIKSPNHSDVIVSADISYGRLTEGDFDVKSTYQ